MKIDPLYYISSISVVYLLISYPKYWENYSNRPEYELEVYGNYHVIVASNSTYTDCYRIMSISDAKDRIKFANDISTELVIILLGIDWVLLFIGGIASTVLWYKSRHTPSLILIREHSILEGLGLVSLLIFSPLSYPAIIDRYDSCLDDNLLMKYNIYSGIFVALCSGTLCIVTYTMLYLVGWNKGFIGFFVGTTALLMMAIMLIVTIWVTYNTNSMLSLCIIVVQTGVAVFTLYEDYLYTFSIEKINKPNEEKP